MGYSMKLKEAYGRDWIKIKGRRESLEPFGEGEEQPEETQSCALKAQIKGENTPTVGRLQKLFKAIARANFTKFCKGDPQAIDPKNIEAICLANLPEDSDEKVHKACQQYMQLYSDAREAVKDNKVVTASRSTGMFIGIILAIVMILILVPIIYFATRTKIPRRQ